MILSLCKQCGSLLYTFLAFRYIGYYFIMSSLKLQVFFSI